MAAKKILMILTEFPPSIGGMQTHAIALSKHLHNKGFKLEVVTYRKVDKYTEEIDRKFPFPIHRSLSRISYFYNIDILFDIIKNFSPDYIYSSTIFYGILEKLSNIPVFCRSVGNDIMRPWIVYPYQLGLTISSSYFLEKHLYKFFKKIDKPEILEALLRKKRLELTVESAKASNKILANSDFTKQLLIDKGVSSQNIEIIVGGVDYLFFKQPNNLNKDFLKQKLGFSPDKKIILTACRLVDKKGVDLLISSFTPAKFQKQNSHLVIVGTGRRMQKLIKLTLQLGLEKHITFVGAVSYEQMPQYYWIADVFVLASYIYKEKTTGLKDAETMGRVLCEANAAGVPVLASNSGGIPSVIKDGVNGLLFEELNFEEMQNKLDLLLKNSNITKHLITEGIKIAKDKFDWKHILKAHEKLLKKEKNIEKSYVANR